MKRNAFLLSGLAAVSMCLSACDEMVSPLANVSSDAETSDGSSQPAEDAKIREIYNLYLENGGTLSYEEWLASIKGEDGADGLTPYIGGNGNWWIGETDTGVKAAGSDGKDGAHDGETFTITFHPNGGSMDSETVVTVNWGDCLNLPSPMRIGYDFAGWWTATGDVNRPSRQWSELDAVFADFDLYAHWDLAEVFANEVEEAISDIATSVEKLGKNFVSAVYGPRGLLGTLTKTDYAWRCSYLDGGQMVTTGMAKLSDGHWWSFSWDEEKDEAVFPEGTYKSGGEYYFPAMNCSLEESDLSALIESPFHIAVYVDPIHNVFYDSSNSASLGLVEILTGGYIAELHNAFTTLVVEPQGGGSLTFVGADFTSSGELVRTEYKIYVSEVGNASFPDIEDKIASGYLPEPYSRDPIKEAFAPLQEHKSMTVAISGHWFDYNNPHVDPPESLEGVSPDEKGYWDYEGKAKVTPEGLEYVNTADGGFLKLGKNPSDPESPLYRYSRARQEEEPTTEPASKGNDIWNSYYGLPAWSGEAIDGLCITQIIEGDANMYSYLTGERYEGVKNFYCVAFGAESNLMSTSSGLEADALLYDLASLLDPRANLGEVYGPTYKWVNSLIVLYEDGAIGFQVFRHIGNSHVFGFSLTLSDFGTTELTEGYMEGAQFPEA